MCAAAWEAYEEALNDDARAADGGSAAASAADPASAAGGGGGEAAGHYDAAGQWVAGYYDERGEWVESPAHADDGGGGWHGDGGQGGIDGDGGDDDGDDGDNDDEEEAKAWVDPQVLEAVAFCRHGRKLQLANLLGTGFSPDSRGERGRTLLMYDARALRDLFADLTRRVPTCRLPCPS
jgi:hypothetical protein